MESQYTRRKNAFEADKRFLFIFELHCIITPCNKLPQGFTKAKTLL